MITYCKFVAVCVSERILQISHYLAKIRTRRSIIAWMMSSFLTSSFRLLRRDNTEMSCCANQRVLSSVDQLISVTSYGKIA